MGVHILQINSARVQLVFYESSRRRFLCDQFRVTATLTPIAPPFAHTPRVVLLHGALQWFRDTKRRISVVIDDFLHVTASEMGTFDRCVRVYSTHRKIHLVVVLLLVIRKLTLG